ncbi:MAG: peptide deformylase [Gammaproteobacteria bacterium]|nr:peptide deformylase [Gammaproteobacteria bacterium]
MAIRTILHYPDPRLRTVAKPVTEFDNALRTLAQDMAETMYDAPGIGLAATQVDVHQRVVVIDITHEKNDLRVLINPEIVERRGEEEMEEGCLSVPGIYDTVTRADWVRVRARDVDGKEFEIETDGLLAVCIQHEIDHLDGKVFVDYLSRLKQQRIQKKLEKQSRVAM